MGNQNFLGSESRASIFVLLQVGLDSAHVRIDLSKAQNTKQPICGLQARVGPARSGLVFTALCGRAMEWKRPFRFPRLITTTTTTMPPAAALYWPSPSCIKLYPYRPLCGSCYPGLEPAGAHWRTPGALAVFQSQHALKVRLWPFRPMGLPRWAMATTIPFKNISHLGLLKRTS